MAKTSKRNGKRERLILLDAHAIIHRAYHALPAFTGPDGAPTGALYGLSAMLLRIIQELRPDYLVAAYDLPKPTIRHEAYEGYKATRTRADDELVAQLKTSRKVFEAFGIPIYEREGFEADDIIGTIAHELKDRDGLDLIIATGDMDAMQLVDDDRVRVYTLRKGMNDTVMYDESAVEERYGFPPRLVADWKGLRGDPSDNIKGVPGIGEKTATELVTKFGEVEELYAALKKDERKFLKRGIKPRIVTILKEHEEDALFSKMLATIRTDAPIAFALPKKKADFSERLAVVLALFDELGFRSLRARARSILGGDMPQDAEAPPESDNGTAWSESTDPEQLAEAKVMLWLLVSDFTDPSPEDICAYTKTSDIAKARASLAETLKKTGRLEEVYERIERPLIPVISTMESHGVLVDRAALAALAKKYRTELGEIEEKIFASAGGPFNVNSPKQLGGILFDKLGLVVKGAKKTAGGARSTRE